MKRTMLLVTVFSIGCFLIVEPANAQDKRRTRNTTISTNGERRITDCEQVRIQIGDGEAIRSKLMQTVPRSSISTLQVRASKNGGIHVQGWDRNEYSITACLAAAGEDTNDAKALLDQLKLSVSSGQVTVEGPSPQDWMAFLIIQAPNGADLDLSSGNGPIGVSDFTGNIQARNQNGPISFHDVNGQTSADVQNGPITVSGSGGTFRLNAQNGPLTVDLEGSQWSGELEGSTQNGPLTLKLPDNYVSSVRVDASKHSPVECRAIQCQQAVRTWDRPNVIQFGDSAPVIRLSTINGPVTIVSPGGKR
ncbi:MAG TPA: DUF4097 family beta strand repeat-containing protein [Blastocatellia bacterium]|nr:DUF4097 family beta strand repeat-containing protein [Blastocatellia bacterium]